jgi:hypothetical protein
MTLKTEPEQYRIETKTATVGDTVSVPYHSVGISIHPLTPFAQSVTVSYLAPADAEIDYDEAENQFTINELVYDLGDDHEIELPFYATGTTVFSPLDDESTFVYYLA